MGHHNLLGARNRTTERLLDFPRPKFALDRLHRFGQRVLAPLRRTLGRLRNVGLAAQHGEVMFVEIVEEVLLDVEKDAVYGHLLFHD